MAAREDFFNLYRHGFVRVALATPALRVGDPAFNARGTVELMRGAAREQALLAAAEGALAGLMRATRALPLAALVGLPVQVDGLLYNCAALVCRGRLVGVAPKSFLPNYREFYELRQFTPGETCPRREITLAGQSAPFGTDLVFRLDAQPPLKLYA